MTLSTVEALRAVEREELDEADKVLHDTLADGLASALVPAKVDLPPVSAYRDKISNTAQHVIDFLREKKDEHKAVVKDEYENRRDALNKALIAGEEELKRLTETLQARTSDVAECRKAISELEKNYREQTKAIDSEFSTLIDKQVKFKQEMEISNG